MTHLLVIDEIKFILSENQQIVVTLENALRLCRDKGVGILCMSQEFSDFEEINLSGLFGNKIIHQLGNDKDINVLKDNFKLLGLGIYHHTFEVDLFKLMSGHAYLSFIDTTNNQPRKPIKVGVNINQYN
jgi:hypothetical protein